MQSIRKNFNAEKHHSDSGDPLVPPMILLGVLVIIALTIYVALVTTPSESPAAGAGQEEVAEENIPAEEVAVEQAPAEPVNWTPLVFGGGILLGVVGLGGAGFITYKSVSAGKKAHRNKKENQDRIEKAKLESIRRWDNMRDAYQSIVSRYSKYETDIWKALKYPALHDVNVSETSAFLKQLRKTEHSLKEQENAEKGSIGGSDELLEMMNDCVQNLEDAFNHAENKALKTKWNLIPKDERKDLKQAVQLLKHAENEGNSIQARQTYYEQLQKVVDRLNARHSYNIIPDATIKFLSSGSDTLLLTDGKSEESLGIDEFLKSQDDNVIEELVVDRLSVVSKIIL